METLTASITLCGFVLSVALIALWLRRETRRFEKRWTRAHAPIAPKTQPDSDPSTSH